MSPDCIAIERLDEPLTESEQAHLRNCSRCEAELSLWRSFDDSRPAADEGAAVQWVVAELRRRRTAGSSAAAQVPPRGWLAALGWPRAAALAAMVLAIGAGYLAWDATPVVNPPARGAQTYRAVAVRAIAPSGDLSSPPTDLTWEAIDGAVRYDAQVLEVDRTLLWSGSTVSSRIALPAAVVSRIVPGKTLLWSVTAVDGGGRRVADSGMQSFRVVATGSGRH